VRKVFFPGWPQPARQVIFSAADLGMDVSGVCLRTAQALASENAGKVCLVEADFQSRALEQGYGRTSTDGGDSSGTAGAMRMSSRQISDNLWFVSADLFLGSAENEHSAPWLRSRLGELRSAFDYSVVHAGPVPGAGGTALLAHLADGLVLGLEAHRTRRLAAKKVKELLEAVNVRLLGVVLSERRFPIPEKLYRRV
jgi:Mrp family chromosome partitioning ATPase